MGTYVALEGSRDPRSRERVGSPTLYPRQAAMDGSTRTRRQGPGVQLGATTGSTAKPRHIADCALLTCEVAAVTLPTPRGPER